MTRIPHPRHERNLTHLTLFTLLLARKLGQWILHIFATGFFFANLPRNAGFFYHPGCGLMGTGGAGVSTRTLSCLQPSQWCLVDRNVLCWKIDTLNYSSDHFRRFSFILYDYFHICR